MDQESICCYLFTSSSSLSEARGTADVRPAFRFVAAIVLRTSSLTNGMDFLREASRMSGVASIPLKKGLSLFINSNEMSQLESSELVLQK